MEKIILVDAWNTFVTEDGMFEDMKSLLDNFSNKKIIVTNANEEQMVQFGIVNMPYEVFTLSHNPDKVDPEYFNKLFEKYSIEAKDVIYFEHNLNAIKSAESLGIKTHHYDKDSKDLDALRIFIEANL